jgi:serine protease Do
MKQTSSTLFRKFASGVALIVVLALTTASFGQVRSGGTGRMGGGRGAAVPVPTTAPAITATAPATAEAPKPYATAILAELASLKPAPDQPTTTADLKAIQDRVEVIARHALPAIVNIMVSDGQGSGVIVSPDGYVLTAGHVSGTPNQPVRIRLSNGTVVDGKALGTNDQLDSGMIKITTPNTYAFMPVGSTKELSEGQWVMAMGHPGGYQYGRPPVVRLGKVLNIRSTWREWFIQSDCPLIMGDSGGPLFDLNGFVIGINSKIGRLTTSNVHVPIDTYTQTWDRLARGDEWGRMGFLAGLGGGRGGPSVSAPPAASLSITANDDPNGVIILQVFQGKAAYNAGLAAEDIITKINDKVVKDMKDLAAELAKLAPGKTVSLELLRKDSSGKSSTLVKKVTLDAADAK